MHVARRYDAKSYVSRKVDQRPGEPQIAPDVVTLDLDEEPVAPEYRTAPLGEPARRPTPLRPQDRRKQPLPAAGQHDESRMSGLERREVEPRIAPVVPAKVRFRDQPAQIRVPLGRFGEQRHVRPVEQRYFRAGDRLDAELLRLLRERHRAV